MLSHLNWSYPKAREQVLAEVLHVMECSSERRLPITGSLITFSQAVFIALQSLPSFLEWRKHASGTWFSILLPHLKKRVVPLHQWALQVCVLTGGSLLNNWALAYDVPLSLHIVFRSSSNVTYCSWLYFHSNAASRFACLYAIWLFRDWSSLFIPTIGENPFLPFLTIIVMTWSFQYSP